MDLRRLRSGEWLAAASGVALLVSLFLPWYGTVELPAGIGPGEGWATYGPLGESSVNAWESFRAIDVLLAFVAASGVLLAIVTAAQGVPAVPVALSALVTLVGLFGVVLVLIRVIDVPDGTTGREWALWLGLASTAGIVAGAMRAMGDERLSPEGSHTDLTGRPAPPPAELEPIPPPRP